MKKIFLIASREYLSRVKKKSFILMTFLGPLLIAGMYALAIFLAIKGDELNEKKGVQVIDESGYFIDKIRDSKTLHFTYLQGSLDSAKANLNAESDDYLLYIPADTKEAAGSQLYSGKQASFSVVNHIEKELEANIKDRKLIDNGIKEETLESLNVNVSLETKRLTDKGEESGSTGASYGIGMLSSILIYLFIFLYGVQVMRGVIEEKNNRIVEVIISSVKPFQLMMGKICGIALVGLTQFVLWIVLTSAISGVITSQLGTNENEIQQFQSMKDPAGLNQNNSEILEVVSAIQTIDFTYLLLCFVFYFLGGYLLYSALFAAIGSAVDSESETQQFMFPVTIPLIFSFVLASSSVVNNPDGPIAFWLSLIPLTSPVVMMVRIPFGVPLWQLLSSMLLLIAGFFGTVWVAAKIYRTGILMYGKKVTFKEMLKWLRY